MPWSWHGPVASKRSRLCCRRKKREPRRAREFCRLPQRLKPVIGLILNAGINACSTPCVKAFSISELDSRDVKNALAEKRFNFTHRIRRQRDPTAGQVL